MRTTITLEPDVEALVEAERRRTGESFKEVVNRLLRRAAGSATESAPELPLHEGRPLLDVADVSAVLTALDEKRRAERSLP
jgi:hypothetical protein